MFTHRKTITLCLILMGCAFLGMTGTASATDEEYAAKIRKALHAVVQAAKEFQTQTGKEASSLDEIKAANLLTTQDNNQMYVVDDVWQVWGDKTGSYIMWNKEVAPEVCRLLNYDNKLPVDPSGMPLKDRGLQCVFYLDRYHVLEPVYIHGE